MTWALPVVGERVGSPPWSPFVKVGKPDWVPLPPHVHRSASLPRFRRGPGGV
jgi:hypothetical protein